MLRTDHAGVHWMEVREIFETVAATIISDALGNVSVKFILKDNIETISSLCVCVCVCG